MPNSAGNQKSRQAAVSPADEWLTDLPAVLGEGRSTQRLLNVLGRLEAYHANLAAANAGTANLKGGLASGTQITAEINRLKAENRQLRQRQHNAIERLDALLVRLPALMQDDEQSPDSAPAANTAEPGVAA